MPPSPDPSTLQAFLDHPSRPAGTLSYHELQGFLFTVVSAPELVRPSEWLPIIFAGEEAGFTSPDEAQGILGQIMALYNTINAAVLDPPTLLPADCPLRDDVLANFEDDAPIAQWSRGFLRGHQWLEDLWKESVPEELAEELGSILMTLSFFSSREMAPPRVTFLEFEIKMGRGHRCRRGGRGAPLGQCRAFQRRCRGHAGHHDRPAAASAHPACSTGDPTRGAQPSLTLDIHSECIYIYSHYMTRKVLHSFYLDPDLTDGLKVASEAEYMPQSQIVRSAIREWLRRREYLPKRATRRGGTKKR